MKLLKADHASPKELPAYETALTALAASCAEGADITFSVDANAQVGGETRLRIMQQVAKAAQGRKGIDCTTAALEAASGSPVVASTPTPDPIRYELGSKATTSASPPACVETVGAWTGTNGPGITTVFVNADGPTRVTVDVARKRGSDVIVSAEIKAGQITHQFDLKIDALSVARVKITATNSPQEVGGSCFAPGSPTA